MKGPARTPDSAFWVDRADVEGDRLRLSAAESRHLLRVFRAAPGASFEAIDGEGILYRCVLESASDGIAAGRIESRVENAGELAAKLIVLAGLPDLPQVETIVSLAVPLGATAIDFVATGRSDRGALPPARIERLGRIARSALKQSRRTRLPLLRSSEGLEAASRLLPEGSTRFLAEPGGAFMSKALREADQVANLQIVMAVGPPGGFLRDETALLQDRGFAPISLGPSRLTTSTAVLVLLATTRNLILASGLGPVDKTGPPGYLQ